MRNAQWSDEVQSLGWEGWGILTIAFIGLIVGVNTILPIPDINDFAGLGQFCLLMERRGLLHCVNFNWGFANPLLCYLLTSLTGNLLVAQRLLSAVGVLAVLLATGSILRRVAGMQNRWARVAALTALMASYWVVQLSVSTHLDVLPLACVLVAVRLSWRADRWSLIAAGFLAGMSFWFRFHFLIYAVLFPVYVAVALRHGERVRRTVTVVLGLSGALMVVGLMNLAATGSFRGSNASLQFALNLPDFQWSVDYMLQVQRMSFLEVLKQVDVFRMIKHVLALSFSGPIMLFLFLGAATLFGEVRQFLTGRRTIRGGCLDWLTRADLRIALLPIYASIPLLLLVPIRGLTLRFEATVLVMSYPWLMAQVVRFRETWRSGLAVAVVVLAMSSSSDELRSFRSKTKAWKALEAAVDAAVPSAVVRSEPDALLCGVADFQNRESKYWLWNPVVWGGWPTLSTELRDEFGVVELDDAGSVVQSGARFAMLAKAPRYVFERFDPRLTGRAECLRDLGPALLVDLECVDSPLLSP